jgi:hypothetical protein
MLDDIYSYYYIYDSWFRFFIQFQLKQNWPSKLITIHLNGNTYVHCIEMSPYKI